MLGWRGVTVLYTTYPILVPGGLALPIGTLVVGAVGGVARHLVPSLGSLVKAQCPVPGTVHITVPRFVIVSFKSVHRVKAQIP